jgi:hypothetical protein
MPVPTGTFSVSFTLTEVEVEAYYRSIRLLPPGLRRAITWLVLAASLLFVALGALQMAESTPGSGGSATGLPFILLGPTCLVLLWHGRRTLPRRMVREMVRRQRQGDLFERMQATIAPDGLHIETPRTRTRWRWHAVRNLRNATDADYFQLSDVQAVIIPHRAFPDEETRREAVAAAEAWRAAAPFYERTCPECNYDLRGTFERRCPECGWSGPSEAAAA